MKARHVTVRITTGRRRGRLAAIVVGVVPVAGLVLQVAGLIMRATGHP